MDVKTKLSWGAATSGMSKTANVGKRKIIGTLGPVEIRSGAEAPNRMAILLWGSATCGKTTFAATAPGDKLWISFGDQEHVSVMHRPDVYVANVSALTATDLFKHAQSENPFNLDKILSDNENIETVVCDSLTAISFKALQHSVSKGIGMSTKGGGFTPTMEAPGQGAYGGRNAIVLETITGLLRVTAKHNVHIIITAHEDDPVTMVQDGKEIISYIGVMLGGKLVNNVTWRLSEIWYMSIDPHGDKDRRLAIRPTRLHKPMKSRMFSQKEKHQEFVLKYDADLPDGANGQMTIAGWYDQWIGNGGKKIPMPPPKVRETK